MLCLSHSRNGRGGEVSRRSSTRLRPGLQVRCPLPALPDQGAPCQPASRRRRRRHRGLVSLATRATGRLRQGSTQDPGSRLLPRVQAVGPPDGCSPRPQGEPGVPGGEGAGGSAQAHTQPRAISSSSLSELLMKAEAETPSTGGEGAHAAGGWGRSSQWLSELCVPTRSPGPEADPEGRSPPDLALRGSQPGSLDGRRSLLPGGTTERQGRLGAAWLPAAALPTTGPLASRPTRGTLPQSLPLKTGVLSRRRFPRHSSSRTGGSCRRLGFWPRSQG